MVFFRFSYFINLRIYLSLGDGNWRQVEAWNLLLAGRVRWMLLLKERYGDSLCGSGRTPNLPIEKRTLCYCTIAAVICWFNQYVIEIIRQQCREIEWKLEVKYCILENCWSCKIDIFATSLIGVLLLIGQALYMQVRIIRLANM